MVFANFQKIGVFEKSGENTAILVRFSDAKTMKIRWKLVLKMCCFPISILNDFFLDFSSMLEAKNRLKIDNFRKNWGWKASSETILLENCF